MQIEEALLHEHAEVGQEGAEFAMNHLADVTLVNQAIKAGCLDNWLNDFVNA